MLLKASESYQTLHIQFTQPRFASSAAWEHCCEPMFTILPVSEPCWYCVRASLNSVSMPYIYLTKNKRKTTNIFCILFWTTRSSKVFHSQQFALCKIHLRFAFTNSLIKSFTVLPQGDDDGWCFRSGFVFILITCNCPYLPYLTLKFCSPNPSFAGIRQILWWSCHAFPVTVWTQLTLCIPVPGRVRPAVPSRSFALQERKNWCLMLHGEEQLYDRSQARKASNSCGNCHWSFSNCNRKSKKYWLGSKNWQAQNTKLWYGLFSYVTLPRFLLIRVRVFLRR